MRQSLLFTGLFAGLLLLRIAPVLSIPAPLQTELTERDLQRIEQLIEIAQTHSPPVQEARANLGLAPFNEVIILGVGTRLNWADIRQPEHDRTQEQNFSMAALCKFR